MMRVLLNTKPLIFSNKTGIGYYVLNLYRALLKSGINIVPTFDTKSGTLLSSLSTLSSHLGRLLGKRYTAVVKTIGDAMLSYMFTQKTSACIYDLYHETNIDPIPEIKVRSVCTLHDLSFIKFPEFFTGGFARETAQHVTKNLSVVKRIIVCTRFIKDEVVSTLKLPEEKIDVIPEAPSASYYRIEKTTPPPEKVKRFTEKEYILYVGTVEPRKNLKTLMRAFSVIRKRHDLSMIIAGGFGWLYDDIVSYPEELGIKKDIIFTKYVDEETLLYLYNYASVFVYPSLYEGFGLPPLEAMACGVPVIISNIPPLTEVAGDAVITFNPKDHEELADAVDKVLSSESLRFEMIQKGFQRAKRCSWENVAASTIQTYAKALER